MKNTDKQHAKETYKDKILHPTFTQVAHYNETICRNSLVYIRICLVINKSSQYITNNS